ncbi:RHS domain-containing protein [Streptococcus sp. Marseille-Q7087]
MDVRLPQRPDRRYRHLQYDSYEPLAQVRNWTNEDGESRQQTHYFHCDQIGIPREMTDKDGNLLWYGEYTAWKNHYKCKSYLT